MPKRSKPGVSVSVVIPCYNDGKYLLEAIKSVESCTEKIYEIIIVNDGSRDKKTLKLLSKLKKEGYKVMSKVRNGPSSARNLGISKSSGRYILALDADNKINPDYMIKAVEILDDDLSVGVVYGDCVHFDGVSVKHVVVGDFDLKRLLRDNYIDTCAVFRRLLWNDCGGYDNILWENWELWIHAASRGWKFRYIPSIMFFYRIRPKSLAKKCLEPRNKQMITSYIRQRHSAFISSNM